MKLRKIGNFQKTTCPFAVILGHFRGLPAPSKCVQMAKHPSKKAGGRVSRKYTENETRGKIIKTGERLKHPVIGYFSRSDQ